MDRREAGHTEFYRIPRTSWAHVEVEVLRDVQELAKSLDGVGSADGSPFPQPGELAVRLIALGTRLLASVAADEADLRQVITTLRTALTVCWDMYGIDEAEQTTVREHMRRLQSGIESFEAELVALHGEQPLDEGGNLPGVDRR